MDKSTPSPIETYRLDAQIGFKLRLANQRHLEVFSRVLPQTTPTQLAVLAKLLEVGDVSQNHLGRMVGMDAATTKGVVDRLQKKRLLVVTPSQVDRRRLVICLSKQGHELIADMIPSAIEASRQTTANLTNRESARLVELLDKL
ncbi:MAG: winged helix-turn-helix transcriptional regulator [Alphaproteobacteria bacterium]|nr:winged helix-turn-helix transcriptional regulator [Alphaproteobacteria bacterium]